jgi:membrane protein
MNRFRVAREVWALVRDAVKSWIDDYAPSMGAALAYYTMFSIAPLLLIVIAVAGLAFGEQAARGEIVSQLRTLMGEDGARAVEALLVSVKVGGTGIVGTLGGVFMLLVGATTVFAELQNAMDRIWRAPERANEGGVWTLLRTRLLSLGMIMGIGFLLVVSLVVSAGLAALARWWGPLFGDARVLACALDFSLSFVIVTSAFAMIYKWMPRVRLHWRDVWTGAAVTALLFTIGKMLIGTYLGSSGISSGFGAAASLVVMVVWVYYSAQVFLLGVEFTRLYAMRYGSLRERSESGPH